MLRVLTILTAVLVPLCPAASLPSIAEKTKEAVAAPGFHTVYWTTEGKLLLEVSHWRQPFLYVPWLVSGVGSNDLGLDRGVPGGGRLVQWERHGNKVLLVQPNLDFRATSDNPAERRAVEDAFAQSVLWGFDAVATADRRVLVDATEFFVRDVLDLASQLKETDSGTFRREASRSVALQSNSKNFEKNTEIESLLTFVTDKAGPNVSSVTPDPSAVSVRVRHSLVELPSLEGYRPREYDPRSGFFIGADYLDYSAPLDQPIRKSFIARHRLVKRDSNAAISEPVERIVYYLDPGTPEPVRSALLEGGRWWADAFEAAGFRNAFRVEMLPEDADPLDLRYNVIQWVHRSTRGWSVGRSIVDPRTGEILKGHVTLGSLRVRQDYLIAEGLLAPYESGKPAPPDMERMALARLRQLSAHEIGHTLGLRHNYAASVSDRASVMDYPHPLAGLTAAGIDLSRAYAAGIGAWDKAAIAWGYAQYPTPAAEKAGLEKLLAAAKAEGLQFIADADAGPKGSAHPQAHLWDNNPDAAAELLRVLEIREAALARFGERSIREGRPLALLEETLVPLFAAHRYQAEAAVKAVGGLLYDYSVRESTPAPDVKIVDPGQQRAALRAVLKTLDPKVLTVPESILRILPPRPPGYPRNRETFPSRTGVTFDPLAAAEAAANHSLELLLHPERAARLVQYSARMQSAPSLDEVLKAVVAAVWTEPRDGLERAVQETVQRVALYHLFRLGSGPDAPFPLKTAVLDALAGLSGSPRVGTYAKGVIDRFREKPDTNPLPAPLQLPPGAPI